MIEMKNLTGRERRRRGNDRQIIPLNLKNMSLCYRKKNESGSRFLVQAQIVRDLNKQGDQKLWDGR